MPTICKTSVSGRDSIERLGRAEIAASSVPMPREGTAVGSRTYHRNTGTGSYLHGSVSGVLSDGTPVVVQTAPDSNTLKWFVMGLAAIVFLYAGFLVWQLLRPPAAQDTRQPVPAAEVAPERPVPPPQPAEAEAADGERPAPTPDVKKAPERKSSTVSPRSRRRRARTTGPRVAKPAPQAGKPKAKAEPTPAPPRPDPVDIDIQNPYRN